MHRRTTLFLAGAATLAALTTPALAAGHGTHTTGKATASKATTTKAPAKVKPTHVRTTVVGTVVSVTDGGLVVSSKHGGTTTVLTTADTVVTRDGSTVTLADLVAGDHVAIKLVRGTAVRVNAESPEAESEPTESPEATESPEPTDAPEPSDSPTAAPTDTPTA